MNSAGALLAQMICLPSFPSTVLRVSPSPFSRSLSVAEGGRRGVSVAEILADFPDLELADIQAGLFFAARRADFPRLTA